MIMKHPREYPESIRKQRKIRLFLDLLLYVTVSGLGFIVLSRMVNELAKY